MESSAFWNFPTPRDDELLYSLVSRIHIASGSTSARKTLSELFGDSNVTIQSGMPTHLNAFTQRLNAAGLDPITSDAIILRHTLTPYYWPALRTRKQQEVTAKLYISNGGLKPLVGLLAWRLGAGLSLRWCPVCSHHDINRFGHTYWRRAHQLPGVTSCHEHGVILQCLPFVLGDPLRLPPLQWLSSDIASYHAQLFARWSRQLLLEGSRTALTSNLAKSCLLSAGLRRGGRVAAERASDLVYCFHNGFEYLRPDPAVSIESLRSMRWLSALYRTPRSDHHPVHYLLLFSALLRDNIAIPSLEAIEASDQKTHRYPNAVAEQTMSLADRRYRPKKLLDDVRSAMIQAARKGHKTSKIATDFGFSIAHVNRLIRETPGLQQAVLSVRYTRIEIQKKRQLQELLAQHEYSRNVLRKKHLGLYTWLLRHDRAWLHQKIRPEKRRLATVNVLLWRRRDVALLARIKTFVATELDSDQKPIRLSSTALLRNTGATRWARVLNKLPLSRSALAALGESAFHFQRRRIDWAIANIDWEQPFAPKRWRILRAAGIRHSHSDQHVDYVSNKIMAAWAPKAKNIFHGP